jgi:hypothetical protein
MSEAALLYFLYDLSKVNYELRFTTRGEAKRAICKKNEKNTSNRCQRAIGF